MNCKRIVAGILTLVLAIGVFNPKVMAATATSKASSTNTEPTIMYRTHVQQEGWQDYVANGAMSGTSGKSYRLEAIQIKLDSKIKGSVQYRVHVQQEGWQDFVCDNEVSGTSGKSYRLEAIEIELAGDIAKTYDVYYRVHCQNYGWMNWVKNGEMAGTSGESKRLEGIEIKLVKKSQEKTASVKYRTHVQTYGWQKYVKDGEMSGTSGESKRLEGIYIDVDSNCMGGIKYRTHVQTYGWQDYVTSNNFSGTQGESKRLEAIQIELYGEIAQYFDVYYRVHAQTYGWLDWAKNGEKAGTEGLAKRLEGIEIKLVKKGSAAPGETKRPLVNEEVLKAEEEAKKILEEEEKRKAAEEAAKKAEEEAKKAAEEAARIKKLPVADKINAVVLNPMPTNDPKVDARVQEIFKEIFTPGMTTYDKVMAIHLWIANNSTYKYDEYTGSWGNTSVNYVANYDRRVVSFACTILFSGYGTCYNYNAAFVVMTRALGLDSYWIEGGWGSTTHAWAMVKIGEEQFFCDSQIEADYNKSVKKTAANANYFFFTEDQLKARSYTYGQTTFQQAIDNFKNFKTK